MPSTTQNLGSDVGISELLSELLCQHTHVRLMLFHVISCYFGQREHIESVSSVWDPVFGVSKSWDEGAEILALVYF